MALVTIEVAGEERGDFTIAVKSLGTYSTTTRQDIDEALNEAIKRVRDAYGIDY